MTNKYVEKFCFNKCIKFCGLIIYCYMQKMIAKFKKFKNANTYKIYKR